MVGKIGISNTKLYKSKGCYVVRRRGSEQIELIYNWVYNNASVYLERKKVIMDTYFQFVKSRGVSIYRGAAWHKNNKKWLSSILYNKKRINLGYYEKEKEAAKAYDEEVIKYDKPLCKLNFSRLGEI